jgi:hypothetical protein
VERDDFDRALNEDLDRLLTQPEPSPHFRARVLQRIDEESESVRGRRWFTVIPAVAATALLLVGAFAWLRVPAGDEPIVSEQAAAPPIATSTRPPAVPGQSTQAPERRSAPRAAEPPPSASDVLISPDDAAAFDAFISSVEDGRLWADMFEPSDDSLPTVIEPLHLEPLATIPPLKEAEL